MLVQTLLTSGKSSRLNRALIDTGIASAVGTESLDDRDPSLLIVEANLQKEQHSSQAETVILREIQRLGRETIPEQELVRAKNRASFDFYEGLGSNSDKAGFLGKYETLLGDFGAGLAIFRKVQSVTVADIQGVVTKYLNPQSRTVVVGAPK